MTADERELRRKRRILDHAVETGIVAKTCGYFGVPRSLFYVWRNAYQEHGEEGQAHAYSPSGGVVPLAPMVGDARRSRAGSTRKADVAIQAFF